MPSSPNSPHQIDSTTPHVARTWNYLLGGKDHYPVDRRVGDEILRVHPDLSRLARMCRAFLARAVTYLARDAGVRQFLDIGTGLPTHNNTHEVAQAVAPESRIVYVDNDPLVLAHARALLVGSPEGVTHYVDADLREPEIILDAAARTLDLERPVALMLMGIMEFLTDDEEAYEVVAQLMAALPAGSYLALYTGTNVVDPTSANEMQRLWNTANPSAPMRLRTPEQVARFFEHLELVDPGLVSCALWRPDPSHVGTPDEIDIFAGVARKR